METEEFEKLVSEAVSSLPEKFKKAIDNVDIVVDERPNAGRWRGGLLLGLYQGVPKTIWGRWQGLIIPDKITIYKSAIEFLGRGDKQKIKELIVDTVRHEIAHHFGISDKRLREIENGK
jgi:predicted Zn-dependent protease with MMP-like domain